MEVNRDQDQNQVRDSADEHQFQFWIDKCAEKGISFKNPDLGKFKCLQCSLIKPIAYFGSEPDEPCNSCIWKNWKIMCHKTGMKITRSSYRTEIWHCKQCHVGKFVRAFTVPSRACNECEFENTVSEQVAMQNADEVVSKQITILPIQSWVMRSPCAPIIIQDGIYKSGNQNS
jgi:hypothetical protein